MKHKSFQISLAIGNDNLVLSPLALAFLILSDVVLALCKVKPRVKNCPILFI